MKNILAKRLFSFLLFTLVLSVGACKSQTNSTSSQIASAESQSSVASTPSPTIDPEIGLQKQQVAQALSKCEAAIQKIAGKKREKEAFILDSLRAGANGDLKKAQGKQVQAQASAAEQNRLKREIEKLKQELRELEKSPHPDVRQDAAQALQRVEEKAKKL